MKPTVDNIGELLALKRHERPDGEYFAEFLREFQRRQRAELMRRRSLGMLWERLSSWMADLGGVKWAYAGGLAYAVLLAGLFFWPHEEAGMGSSAAPVVREVPVPVVVGDQGVTEKAPAETPKRVVKPVEGEF